MIPRQQNQHNIDSSSSHASSWLSLDDDPKCIISTIDLEAGFVMDAMEEGTATEREFIETVSAGGDPAKKLMFRFGAGIDSGIKAATNCAVECNKQAYKLDQQAANIMQEANQWKEKAERFSGIADAYKGRAMERLDQVKRNRLELTYDVLMGIKNTNEVHNPNAVSLEKLRTIFLRTSDFEEIRKLKPEEKYHVLAFSNKIGLHLHPEVIKIINQATTTKLVWDGFPTNQILGSMNNDDDETLLGLIGLYYGCLPDAIKNEFNLVRIDGRTRKWMRK